MSYSWENFQEWVAKRIKGVVQPGSGNHYSKPGDVASETILCECKDTDAASFIVKLQTWDKIRNEAAFRGKLPMMAVRIGKERVIGIFDFEDALALLGEYEDEEG